MMKFRNILILIAFISAVAVPQAMAGTGGKPSIGGWWEGHWTWTKYKNFNGYLENGKDSQNAQWASQDWYVQDWLSQNKDGMALIRGFFNNGILEKQTEEGGVPTLIVGPGFYRLSGYDKRRVITTVDAVYGVTDSGKYPVILLKDWYTDNEIGIYNRGGLQLE